MNLSEVKGSSKSRAEYKTELDLAGILRHNGARLGRGNKQTKNTKLKSTEILLAFVTQKLKTHWQVG